MKTKLNLTYIIAFALILCFIKVVSAQQKTDQQDLKVIGTTQETQTEPVKALSTEKAPSEVAAGSNTANEVSGVPKLEILEKSTPNNDMAKVSKVPTTITSTSFDPLKYTLGPDDVVQIEVLRHSEFGGTYAINQEGKIQLKFVGDIVVSGMTKKQLADKIKEIISSYVINPEVDVTIVEYKSKNILVLGEVGAPGKYYMRSETISVKDAVIAAGLPTYSAAMRRCQLVTPGPNGRKSMKPIDIYTILYGGDLKNNVDMHAGDVLYVPATVMAKVIRVINPVTSAVGVTSEGPNSVSTAKSAFTTLAK